ncbi:MAG: hypothetical protein KGJ45_09380 [Elusimicrobia bacterium]|nr:hypothetical protein [Elusimicrobiota bacterium]
MLAVVARGLRELKDQVVFVGGATVDLYIPNPGGTPLRTTDDVDCVVGIASRVEYGKLEERLRGLGFTQKRNSAFFSPMEFLPTAFKATSALGRKLIGFGAS